MAELGARRFINPVLLVVFLSAVLLLALSYRVVGVGQVGVITSFGHIARIAQSGALVKAPWPVQSLITFDIKTQKDQAEAAASSADLQDVNVTLVTNYHIDPAKVGELYSTVGTDYKSRIVDPAIQESIKATTAQYNVAEMITKRPELKEKALAALKARLESRGIFVEDISIVNLGFSPSFTHAIEQKQVAEQQAQQAKYGLEKAQVDARANAVQQAALTSEILQKMAIDKWDGHLPQATSGTPFINIK